MIENALVFDKKGRTLYWHLPAGRSAGYIPDSREFSQVLWDLRHEMGGVAHTHPWSGPSGPSWEDVTTFSAVERGLGQRYLWPVVTFNHITYCTWKGPDKYDYVAKPASECPYIEDLGMLRLLSRRPDLFGDGLSTSQGEVLKRVSSPLEMVAAIGLTRERLADIQRELGFYRSGSLSVEEQECLLAFKQVIRMQDKCLSDR